jgi:hypothetical protein
MGCQPLKSLKDWLIEEKYRKCTNSPHIEKIWFKLTTDVFVAFLFWIIILLNHCFHLIFYWQGSCLAIIFASILMLVPLCDLQQEIAEASNDAARKYYDEIPKEERSDTSVTAVMIAAAKSKHYSFKG